MLLIDAIENDAVTPVGRPETERVAALGDAEPLARLIVLTPLAPSATLTDVGELAIVNVVLGGVVDPPNAVSSLPKSADPQPVT